MDSFKLYLKRVDKVVHALLTGPYFADSAFVEKWRGSGPCDTRVFSDAGTALAHAKDENAIVWTVKGVPEWPDMESADMKKLVQASQDRNSKQGH